MPKRHRMAPTAVGALPLPTPPQARCHAAPAWHARRDKSVAAPQMAVTNLASILHRDAERWGVFAELPEAVQSRFTSGIGVMSLAALPVAAERGSVRSPVVSSLARGAYSPHPDLRLALRSRDLLPRYRAARQRGPSQPHMWRPDERMVGAATAWHRSGASRALLRVVG